MGELRQRITKAIADAQFAFDQGEPYNGPEDAGVLADAVIAALGLHRESPQLCDGGTNHHRYVTEWERL